MTQVCWWWVNKASGLLDPDERNAVLWDLSESGTSGAQALFDLLGLIVRRQLSLWGDWHPWLALTGVVVPVGSLLSLACRWLAEGSAATFYLYVNGWTWGYLESPGARRDLLHYMGRTLLSYATLICWSYTSGFVIGSLSRRASWVNGTLLGLVLYGELLLVSQHHNPFNPMVWSLKFYRVVFPWLLRTLLVFLPSIWGMRTALHSPALRRLPSVVGAITIAVLTGLAARDLALSGMASWLSLRVTWQLWLLPLVAVWPAGFVVATAKWRHWHSAVFASVLVLALVTGLPALEQTYTAHMVVVVSGPDGKRLVGTTVTAWNRRTNAEFRKLSDGRGMCRFSFPMGAYDVTVEQQGFSKAVRNDIRVFIGGTGELYISLMRTD
jgi:hypothetical protein